MPPLEFETPPQYPEGLEVDSAANAERFLEFAIDTLNYGQRFNDSAAVQSISVPECDFCTATNDSFDSYAEQGLRRVGTELSCTVTNGEYQPESGLFYLHSECTSSEGATYDTAGEVVETYSATSVPITWAVTMVNGPWQLVEAGTLPNE